MNDFNRNRHGGKKFGRKDFGKKSFDSRGSGKGMMYKATCTECGDPCEVPFKPSGDRPVLCSNCFRRDGDSNFRRTDRRFEDRKFSRNYERADRFDRDRSEMYETTCAECGNSCEVPFRPNGNKPVFCNDCFKKDNNGGNTKNKDIEQLKEQFKILDIKLDRILKILVSPPSEPATTVPVEKTKTAKAKKTTKKRKSV